MALGQILRKRREELKLTLDEVGRRTGFSKPYLSTVETGKVNNPPSDELLRKLEQVLEFDSGMLLHMAHVERMPSDVRENYESAEAENQKLRVLLKEVIDSKGDAKKIKKILSGHKITKKKTKTEISPGKVVPVINKVGEGYPTDFESVDYPVGIAHDYVRCPDIHDPNAFAVRIVGDAMEPKFIEGDIIVFSPELEVKNGDDCFINFEGSGETTFKRVFFEKDGTIRLQPRNERYSPAIVKGDRINGMHKAAIKYERL